MREPRQRSHREGQLKIHCIFLHPPRPRRTTGRLSKNEYTFTAEASDNKARFRCEASNIMSQTPLKTEVDLTVLCKYLLATSPAH